MCKPKAIGEWMSDRDMSLEAFAASSGLDRRVVEAIAAGRYTTSPNQRQRLAAALDVPSESIRWGQTVPVDHLYGHGPQFGRSP